MDAMNTHALPYSASMYEFLMTGALGGYVFLKFGNVVRDVIDDMHVQVIWRGVECFCKSL